eukprot:CAMPEP_0181210572 /NCGR_PEP_ID=MMETSP1096-20121128/23306_1 /TAXON_ID=156174 ORGANISM="Chrysochromulina ericina, Strain CCMP281" /NCGR_SAMPLE_ID=MMETSP1096 /ASSEMBLY_ACC=CAM_ASM_000453 /LENGTH=130 /DNA_ID=CAMNT_0023301879 /DNA_START=123 /DNA_END=516 /DNA_ORIENTATION=+
MPCIMGRAVANGESESDITFDDVSPFTFSGPSRVSVSLPMQLAAVPILALGVQCDSETQRVNLSQKSLGQRLHAPRSIASVLTSGRCRWMREGKRDVMAMLKKGVIIMLNFGRLYHNRDHAGHYQEITVL